MTTFTPASASSAAIAPGRREAVRAGHPDVHQDDVGALGPGQLDGLVAVDRLADHLDVVRGLEQHAEAGPDQRLVVGEQYPDHRRAPSSGRFRWAG